MGLVLLGLFGLLMLFLVEGISKQCEIQSKQLTLTGQWTACCLGWARALGLSRCDACPTCCAPTPGLWSSQPAVGIVVLKMTFSADHAALQKAWGNLLFSCGWGQRTRVGMEVVATFTASWGSPSSAGQPPKYPAKYLVRNVGQLEQVSLGNWP